MKKAATEGRPLSLFITYSKLLIVLSVYFEVALRMSANGAKLGCLCADYDVAAVSALPDLNFALSENFLSLNILEESSVALFVVLFDSADHSELSCECREALFFSCLSEAFVHVCPLEVLAVSCSC